MKSIAQSMSTHYVGPFPDNLPEIVSVIAHSKRTIKIVVDFPGYAQYSAPALHLKYIHALEQARQRDVEIQLICYTDDLANHERLKQFPNDPERFKQRDINRFNNFFHLKNLQPATDFAGLRRILIDHDEKTIGRLRDLGVSLKFQHETAPFFLWLADDAEAVFTFKNLIRKDAGLSFRTKDGHLIRQFTDIFLRRWEEAKDGHNQTASTTSQVNGAPHLNTTGPSEVSNVKDVIH
jgi:hypothetical protein